MLGLHVRRVCLSEWLRVLPVPVCLPVFTHFRAMTGPEYAFGQPSQRNCRSFTSTATDVRCTLRPMSPFLSPTFIISMLIALSVHECAHAYAAWKLGDPTAKYDGRLTLNPLAHLDPLGTVMFIIVGFGWGKPVPVDSHYLKHPKRDNAIIAFAGPLSNLLLAWIAFFVLMGLSGNVGTSAMGLVRLGAADNPLVTIIAQVAASSVFINLGLMAFNLLPIAPLDGSKILHPFIPVRFEDAYFEFMARGPIILLLILVAENLLNIHVLSGWVMGIISTVLTVMSLAASPLF